MVCRPFRHRAADRPVPIPSPSPLGAACSAPASVALSARWPCARPTAGAGMWSGRSHCPAAARRSGPPTWSRSGAGCAPAVAAATAAPGSARGTRWSRLAAAVVGVLSLWLLPVPDAWLAALLGWWLLALALIDLRTWLLPDALTLPLMVAGLAVAAALLSRRARRPIDAGLGAGAGYGLLAGLGCDLPPAARPGRPGARRREAAGGRRRLARASPACRGWCCAAALLGLLLALAQRRPLQAETAVPFGPALALAFWGMFMLLAMR